METVPGEEPTRELTKSEAGTLEEKKAEDKRAIDEVHTPFEDEADRIRAKTLESHNKQELSQTEIEIQQTESSIEKSQQETLKKLRAERRASEPLIVRNPKNKPPL